ncbi:unnamed protein product [Phytophthora fragariaefolia]|uniref:Unnamed protein product n=1 Tax=Phytophthora fragariaefolia TaxID=1490495 RepID=A0A9W6YHW8_9STRA|nr:unnamed protein product [Phytophthora fragariaefolia]
MKNRVKKSLKSRFITAINRQQPQTAMKRVIFADTHDEDSEVLPVEPEPPDRPNDVTTESSHVENGETSPRAADRPRSTEDVDPLEVQEERRRRVGRAQDEELRWANLKLVLKGESSSLGYKAAREAWKMEDRFVLSDDGLLYFLGENRRWGKDRMNETVLRLVVVSRMQRKQEPPSATRIFPWEHPGRAATPDCINGFRHLTTEVSEANTASLLFQCACTGFVMAKAMSDTSALCVAQAFEECVYRSFGAPSLVRHDRDPRFMSEVFQALADMMQSRSRATLNYRPQENVQQERSGMPVMQSVHAHHSERDTILSGAWLGRPIDTQGDVASSLKRGFGRQSDALAWRREVNRQQEIALKMAKEYQAVEKEEKASLPRPRVSENSEDNTEDAEDTSTPGDEGPKSLFEPGDRVWLYMERVKPGITKKLAHRWRGPFRVKRKVGEYASELGLPGYISTKSCYRMVVESQTTLAGAYEVESILDDRRPMETSTRRSVRECLVKWVGYDEPTWEPMTNLSCGGLRYDYLREKRSSQRFQMVEVADED